MDNIRTKLKTEEVLISKTKGKVHDRTIQRHADTGEYLGAVDYIEEKLPGRITRRMMPKFNLEGKIWQFTATEYDRYENKALKVIVGNDYLINAEYSKVSAYRGKHKPVSDTFYYSDGQPRLHVLYKPAGAPATHFVPMARYDFNPDGSFTFRERDRQGRIKTEVTFTSDGSVISDASAIRGHEEEIPAILKRAREARPLTDFIDVYRQLEATPPVIK